MTKQLILITALCTLLIFGCGYKFTGGSTKLPAGVSQISVERFVNNTTESGVENVFTNDLIYQCTRNGFYAPLGSGEADAVFKCTIKKFVTESIAHLSDNTSFERRVTAYVDILLMDMDGTIIRHVEDLTESEEYLSDVNDKISTTENRVKAINKISSDLSEKIIERMSEDF